MNVMMDLMTQLGGGRNAMSDLQGMYSGTTQKSSNPMLAQQSVIYAPTDYAQYVADMVAQGQTPLPRPEFLKMIRGGR